MRSVDPRQRSFQHAAVQRSQRHRKRLPLSGPRDLLHSFYADAPKTEKSAQTIGRRQLLSHRGQPFTTVPKYIVWANP